MSSLPKYLDQPKLRLVESAKTIKDKVTIFKEKKRIRKPITSLGSRTKFRKTSFSQCGEDLIINHILGEKGIKRPTYLDIGAHDPYYLNNTALFYLSGSRGVNIEPDPELFKRFIRPRKKDVNLNIGVAEKNGILELHIMSSPTLNTFSKKEAKEYEKKGYPIVKIQKIRVCNINTLLRRYFNKSAPNILSIDIEGLDYQILNLIDYARYSPDIICAETIEFTNDGTGSKDERITRLLKRNGYSVYADTKINTIYVKQKLPVI